MTTALPIIDLQRAILTGLAPGSRQTDMDARLNDVAPRLGRLKHNAEAAGVPVILVQHDGNVGHRLEVGKTGWQLRDEIAPHPTSDFGALTADQIVDHHNRLLAGFDAGLKAVQVAPTATVHFL